MGSSLRGINTLLMGGGCEFLLLKDPLVTAEQVVIQSEFGSLSLPSSLGQCGHVCTCLLALLPSTMC